MNVLSNIELLGLCSNCNTWHPIKKGKDWLPNHKGTNGKKCPNSGYSYSAIEYSLKTAEEATGMAQLIAADKGGCLHGGGLHSMACGNGRYCEDERQRRAQALAEYFLAQNGPAQK
jgi:hypothetical protein